MKKKISPKKLKKKAWKIFSEYIRLKAADEYGYVKCITCGIRKKWKKMQAGHFIDGRSNSILFEETCVHPQDYRCNCLLHGNKVEYFLYMVKTYGQDEISRLRALRYVAKQYTKGDYEKIIKHYRKEVDKLIKIKGE